LKKHASCAGNYEDPIILALPERQDETGGDTPGLVSHDLQANMCCSKNSSIAPLREASCMALSRGHFPQ
jgi:hypothetical protein